MHNRGFNIKGSPVRRVLSEKGIHNFVSHLLEFEQTPERIEEHKQILEKARELLTTPMEKIVQQNYDNPRFEKQFIEAIETISGEHIKDLMISLGITRPEEQRHACFYLKENGINPYKVYFAQQMLKSYERNL